MRVVVPAAIGLTGLLVAFLAFPNTGGPVRRALGKITGLETCISDHRKMASIALANYDLAFAGGDLNQVDNLSAAAFRAVQTSLDCAPLQADMWVDSARLRVLDDGLSDSVFADLDMSCRLAAHQYWTAERRLRAFGAVSRSLPQQAQGCLRHDQALLANRRAAGQI